MENLEKQNTKTFTTVRQDGAPGPDIKAKNIFLAEDKLKELDTEFKYKVVGEKIVFYYEKDC